MTSTCSLIPSFVLHFGANDGIFDFAVVQVDADFVIDRELALWFPRMAREESTI
jgi:hypothetical protein